MLLYIDGDASKPHNYIFSKILFYRFECLVCMTLYNVSKPHKNPIVKSLLKMHVVKTKQFHDYQM